MQYPPIDSYILYLYRGRVLTLAQITEISAIHNDFSVGTTDLWAADNEQLGGVIDLRDYPILETFPPDKIWPADLDTYFRHAYPEHII